MENGARAAVYPEEVFPDFQRRTLRSFGIPYAMEQGNNPAEQRNAMLLWEATHSGNVFDWGSGEAVQELASADAVRFGPFPESGGVYGSGLS